MTSEPSPHVLNDGNTLPVIGFGTYQLRGDDGRVFLPPVTVSPFAR